MKPLILLFTLSIPLFALLFITGYKTNYIPSGIYKAEDTYKISLNINGRNAVIDQIRVNKTQLTFYFTVEQNDSTKKVEQTYRYSLDNDSRIVIFGSSNSTLYLFINSNYYWQYKNGAIEQLNPKDLSLVTAYQK